MPRRPRLHLPGVPQHVVQRGNDRRACFHIDDDRRLYLHWLADGIDRFGCDLHAYVLMSNHVHLLLTGDTADSIPGLMQSLGTRYVRYVNRRHGRSGTLWEGRYHASLVDSDTHLLRCMGYIEANPVRASMVATPEQWRWSSFRHNALGIPDRRITPHPVYRALGDSQIARIAAYQGLFDQPFTAAETEALRNALRSGLPTGDEGFRLQVAQRLGPYALPGARGRPVKQRTMSEKRV